VDVGRISEKGGKRIFWTDRRGELTWEKKKSDIVFFKDRREKNPDWFLPGIALGVT